MRAKHVGYGQSNDSFRDNKEPKRVTAFIRCNYSLILLVVQCICKPSI